MQVKLKTIIISTIVLFISIYVFSCFQMVQPGYVGVITNTIGTSKGVSDRTVGVGYQFVGPGRQLRQFPTYSQTYVWSKTIAEGKPTDESINIQSQGSALSADVGITFSIKPDRVSTVYIKYRASLDEILHSFLRNTVRNALVEEASTKTIEEIYGIGKEAFLKAALHRVRSEVGDNFNIESLYFNDLRLPPNIVDAINSKNVATQRALQAQIELKQSEAEAAKTIAKAQGESTRIKLIAQAQADANRILATSVTPELVQYQAVQRWNGILPSTMIPGSATPFINVK